MRKIANRQANEKAVDLTPQMMDDWVKKDGSAAVLVINPEATLHQRAGLAWITATDTLSIMEASLAAHGNDPGSDRVMLCLAIDRVRQLERMLGDIGVRMWRQEGGTA